MAVAPLDGGLSTSTEFASGRFRRDVDAPLLSASAGGSRLNVDVPPPPIERDERGGNRGDWGGCRCVGIRCSWSGISSRLGETRLKKCFIS